jgi:hypothetical protein
MFRIVREARMTAWRVASSRLSGDWDDSSIILTIDILSSLVTPPQQVLRGKPGGQPLFPAEFYVSSNFPVLPPPLRRGYCLSCSTRLNLIGEGFNPLLPVGADPASGANQAHGPEQIPLNHEAAEVPHQVELDGRSRLVRHFSFGRRGLPIAPDGRVGGENQPVFSELAGQRPDSFAHGGTRLHHSPLLA